MFMFMLAVLLSYLEVSLNGRHYVNMAPDLMHFAVEQPITVNITVSASQGEFRVIAMVSI